MILQEIKCKSIFFIWNAQRTKQTQFKCLGKQSGIFTFSSGHTSLYPPQLVYGVVFGVLECELVSLGPVGKKTLNDELDNEKQPKRFSIKKQFTWWGRNELRRWCKFLNIRDMSSTLLAYCDGLSTRTSASSKMCSCNSLLSDLNSFLKSTKDKYFEEKAA